MEQIAMPETKEYMALKAVQLDKLQPMQVLLEVALTEIATSNFKIFGQF
jgi:hypothetical protein